MAFYDNIDWVHYFSLYADAGMQLDDTILNAWCKVAAKIAVNKVPVVVNRFNRGYIDEDTFAWVVISMVARKLRYNTPTHENNGVYTYQLGESDTMNMGVSQHGRSPDFYVSKSEREILQGTGDSNGFYGALNMSIPSDRWA